LASAALCATWCFLFAVLVPGHPRWVFPVLVAATALFAAAELMHAPVSMALASALAPAGSRGRYLAAFQYSLTISGVISPAFLLTLFQGQHGLPWLAVGVMNVGAILALIAFELTIPDAAQRNPAVRNRGRSQEATL
jgi:MFS family permease